MGGDRREKMGMRVRACYICCLQFDQRVPVREAGGGASHYDAGENSKRTDLRNQVSYPPSARLPITRHYSPFTRDRPPGSTGEESPSSISAAQEHFTCSSNGSAGGSICNAFRLILH